jgi:hypothetical protein
MSAFAFFSFFSLLDLDEKNRGEKHVVVVTQAG